MQQKHLMTPFKLNIDPKNAEILESDFGKPYNWETSRDFDNLKFLGVICE